MRRLIDEEDIQAAVAELGKQITADYRGDGLTILGVLTGSIIFIADLVRRVDLPLRIGVIQASSYRGATTDPGELTVNANLLPDVADRNVLLVDDIFDSGHTLAAVTEKIRQQQPRSLRSAVLLWKEGRQQVDFVPDYSCFTIPNEFVVGYGLDYNDEFRQLPYIGVLEEADL